jgi:hypothetical protein
MNDGVNDGRFRGTRRDFLAIGSGARAPALLGSGPSLSDIVRTP